MTDIYLATIIMSDMPQYRQVSVHTTTPRYTNIVSDICSLIEHCNVYINIQWLILSYFEDEPAIYVANDAFRPDFTYVKYRINNRGLRKPRRS